MKVNPQAFFNFCSSHVPLLGQLVGHQHDISEADIRRLIRANPGGGRASRDYLATAAGTANRDSNRTTVEIFTSSPNLCENSFSIFSTKRGLDPRDGPRMR